MKSLSSPDVACSEPEVLGALLWKTVGRYFGFGMNSGNQKYYSRKRVGRGCMCTSILDIVLPYLYIMNWWMMCLMFKPRSDFRVFGNLKNNNWSACLPCIQQKLKTELNAWICRFMAAMSRDLGFDMLNIYVDYNISMRVCHDMIWHLNIIWYDIWHDMILLMEEILHHLPCMNPCKYWDVYHINCCRIFSINSMMQSIIYQYYNIIDSLHQSNCLHMPWQHSTARRCPIMRRETPETPAESVFLGWIWEA